jgi:cyclic pyranopterin phosphate synthase
MPRETFGPDFAFLPRSAILSFEEISRLARIFASFGVRKVRLTGGEPLLRSDLPVLIADLRTIPNLEIAMTTNGALLASHAEALAEAGLDRVTVSLDSLDDATFRAMNDANFPVAKVREGIEAALEAGLGPIKINAVVRSGINDDGVVDLARAFRDTPHAVRFIEYMDVGTSNGWKLDEVTSGQTILDQLLHALPLEPVTPAYRGEVAKRWRYAAADGEQPTGEIGIITSVTQPFCDDCTRARLSAEGKLYTCLFAGDGVDLRGPLRDGASDEAIAELVRSAWSARDDRYSQLRSEATVDLPKIEMSYIGG